MLSSNDTSMQEVSKTAVTQLLAPGIQTADVIFHPAAWANPLGPNPLETVYSDGDVAVARAEALAVNGYQRVAEQEACARGVWIDGGTQ